MFWDSLVSDLFVDRGPIEYKREMERGFLLFLNEEKKASSHSFNDFLLNFPTDDDDVLLIICMSIYLSLLLNFEVLNNNNNDELEIQRRA